MTYSLREMLLLLLFASLGPRLTRNQALAGRQALTMSKRARPAPRLCVRREVSPSMATMSGMSSHKPSTQREKQA